MYLDSDSIKPFFGATTDNINFANLCAIGLPWDKTSTFRLGSIQGPQYIRHASTASLYNPHTELGVNLQEKWQIFDVGDVPISELVITDAQIQTYNQIAKHNKHGIRYLFLGGDHTVTYLSFTSLKKLNNKRMGLIYFDAHPDLYDAYDGDQYAHACVVKRIIDETNIEPESIVQAGIRATTPEQTKYANSVGITTITSKDYHQKGPLAIAEQIKASLPDYLDGVYISVDLDVLDPSYAPGVGNPEPGGLTTGELVETIHGLNGIKIEAFDIVELNPKFDYSGISAFACAKIMKEILGIM